MTRVLLTGASGFIGSRMVDHLQRVGATVVALGRTPVNRDNIENVIVTSLEPTLIRHALGERRIDAVIHLAAAGVHPGDRDLQHLLAINAFLAPELVRIGKELGARAVVMSGSNSEYARSDREYIDESAPLESIKAYGATKAAGGLLATAAGTSLGIATVNLRLFNVFGPGEARHRLLPSMIDDLTEGRDVKLSEGTQARDFLHVDDVCTAILRAAEVAGENNLPTGHYNVCSGEAVSVREFALAVAAAAGAATSRLNFGSLPLRPDDVPRIVGTAVAFRELSGWAPEQPFEQAISNAVHELLHTTSRA